MASKADGPKDQIVDAIRDGADRMRIALRRRQKDSSDDIKKKEQQVRDLDTVMNTRTPEGKKLAKDLRPDTPNQSVRDSVQGKPGPDGKQSDPLYPDIRTDRLEADHVVPLRAFVEMDGFKNLTRDQQVEVANLADNFWGLSKPINASKGGRTPDGWGGHSQHGPLSPEAQSLLDSNFLDGLAAIRDKIDSFN